MAEPGERTNSMRMLGGMRIPYTAHYFSPEIHSATEVAAALGVPPGQVFKTLVTLPQTSKPRPMLAIIPADRELDLKCLAATVAEKKVRMAAHKEAEALTGLLVGGISALALLQKRWRVYLDASAQDCGEILVSAGQRGINLQLAVDDLIKVTGARLAKITRPPAEAPE